VTCFEVYLNGEKLCTAGIGDQGVLTAIVNWISSRHGDVRQTAPEAAVGPPRLMLSVGGLASSCDQHMQWIGPGDKPLKVGDEVMIKVIEALTPDAPNHCHHVNKREHLEKQKQYVAEQLRRLGSNALDPPNA
jgi:hypothetical protein